MAAELDGAAQKARARGAPDAAATLWEQARRFTPGELVDEAHRRGIEAAECHFEAGETERARALLEEIVAASPSGRDRARALTRLAWVRAFKEGFHVDAELFEAGLAEVRDDLRLRIEIERGLAWAAHESGNLPAAEARARAALEMAETLGERAELAAKFASEGGSPGDSPSRARGQSRRLRRFPTSSARAKTGEPADFASAPPGIRSLQVTATREGRRVALSGHSAGPSVSSS